MPTSISPYLIPNLLCCSIKCSLSARSCVLCVISFLVTGFSIALCNISLNIHRVSVRYDKGLRTTYQLAPSCGPSCFKMVTLIWEVFHAIPSPQGLSHTEDPRVVVAIDLRDHWIPSRESQKNLGEKNISDVPKTVMAAMGALRMPAQYRG